MLTVSVIVALVLLNAVSLGIIIRQRTAARASITAPCLDDEDVLGILEAHAVSSPLAGRLLQKAKEELPTIPEWQHTTAGKTPPIEHWGLFLRDMAREADDTARYLCLTRWIDQGVRFTCYEQVEIFGLFETFDGRDAARASFAKEKGDA